MMETDFLSTLKHASNYFYASVATAALGIISVPVMSHILTPADYGTYKVFLSYVAIFAVILSLNGNAPIGRFWYEKKDFNQFFSSAIIISITIFVLSSICLLFYRNQVAMLLDLDQLLILLLVPMVLFSIVDTIFRQVFVPQRRSNTLAKFQIIRYYLQFFAGIGFALLMTRGRYYGVLVGMLIVQAGISIFLIKRLLPYFQFTFSVDALPYFFRFSIPLIPYALSGIILAQLDRIMINSYIDSNAAGLYSLAYKLGETLNLVSVALITAWTPDFFRQMDEKNFRQIDKDIEKTFKIIVASALFLILFGPELGKLLAHEKYHVAMWIVPLVVFGLLFNAAWQFWGRNIGYAKQTHWTSIIALSAGGANIVLNAIFIPRYGYAAGAYTTIVSYMLMAFGAWFVSKYILHLHLASPKIFLIPFGIVLVMYFFSIGMDLTNLSWGMQQGVRAILFGLFVAGTFWPYRAKVFNFRGALE
jgi:O-antigen/teichoic acid export membrane protein